VRVLVDFNASGVVRCEYATTLGAGGMFIETAEPLPVSTPIRVRFRLPQGPELHEIEGRVVWHQRGDAGPAGERAAGMGIEFTQAACTASLARHLERD